jgi:hypothetical protein
MWSFLTILELELSLGCPAHSQSLYQLHYPNSTNLGVCSRIIDNFVLQLNDLFAHRTVMDEAPRATSRPRIFFEPNSDYPSTYWTEIDDTGWMKQCVECAAWEPIDTTLSIALSQVVGSTSMGSTCYDMNMSNRDQMSTWSTPWVTWTDHIGGASWCLGNSDYKGSQIMGGGSLACRTPYVVSAWDSGILCGEITTICPKSLFSHPILISYLIV